MRVSTQHLLPLLLLAGLCALGASSSCQAPLDAAGTYNGWWSFAIVDDNGTVVDTIDCPLGMTLDQDLAAAAPENLLVTGTLHVDFSCFEQVPNWPVWVPIPDVTAIDVSGTMGANGRLVLASGGCTTGACAILVLYGMGSTGMARDTTVPAMALYEGRWGFALGIAFLSPGGVAGTFEVEREQQ